MAVVSVWITLSLTDRTRLHLVNIWVIAALAATPIPAEILTVILTEETVIAVVVVVVVAAMTVTGTVTLMAATAGTGETAARLLLPVVDDTLLIIGGAEVTQGARRGEAVLVVGAEIMMHRRQPQAETLTLADGEVVTVLFFGSDRIIGEGKK
jgi:hypothetical protein